MRSFTRRAFSLRTASRLPTNRPSAISRVSCRLTIASMSRRVRSTSRRTGTFQSMSLTFSLIATETLADEPPCLCYQLIHLQSRQTLFLPLLIFPFNAAASGCCDSNVRHIQRRKQRRCERDISRNITANLWIIFGLVGNQPQLR